MASKKLIVSDFELFYDTISNMTKLSKSAKIIFSKHGFRSSVKTDGRVARLDIVSTSVKVEGEPISICTQELNVFSQILYKVVKAHSGKGKKSVRADYSDVELSIEDNTSIRIKCNMFKTNFGLVKESAIVVLKDHVHNWDTIAEVNVNIEDVKELLSSTFVFRDQQDLLVNICHQDDMVKNIAYAEIYDPKDPTTNKFVTKFGNILVGDITRKILLDIPRFQVISSFPVESMTICLNKQPCAFTNFTINGSDSGNCITKYTLLFEYMSDNYAIVNNGANT